MSRNLINQNFSGQDLRGKDFFSGANLRGANFSGANLQKVDFSNAQLQGANFQEANLREANFTNTSIDVDSSLPKVNFSHANIQGTNFTDAELIGADFTGAKAGLSRSWYFFVIVSSVILCLLSAFPTAIISTFSIYFFRFSRKKPSILVSFFVGIWSVVLTIAIRTVLQGWKPYSVYVGIHVGVGIIMMLMVLFGTIIAIVTTDEKDDFGGVFWSTFIFIVILVCTILYKNILRDLEGYIFSIIGIRQSGFGIFGAIIGAFFGCWFARTAISEKNRFKWLWKIYIRFVTRGGTLFKDADLSNATFNGTILRGTNFKGAKLQRTRWEKVKFLEYARVGNSYLKYPKIRKLILGRKLKPEEKEFNGLNLKGINLEGKNLCKANFIGTNLNQANLRGANLMHANLQQAKLNDADLTGTSLTGACLQDWSIDEKTILSQVKCEYIFQEKLPEHNAGHRRFPPSPENFQTGDFEKIFRKDKGTIQLLIRNDNNKQALINAFEQLKKDTNSNYKFQGLERIGEDFLLKIAIPHNTDTSTVENKFYQTYRTEEENLESKSGLTQYENQSITELILKAFERPTNVTNINGDYIQNSGITQNMSGGTMDGGMQAAQGDHNNQTMDINVVSPEQKQTLAEAAAEIQALLEQLEKSYLTDTTTGKMALATEAIAQIENNPNLTARILSALKVGSVKAFEQFLSHPAASFVIGALEDWQKTKGN